MKEVFAIVRNTIGIEKSLGNVVRLKGSGDYGYHPRFNTCIVDAMMIDSLSAFVVSHTFRMNYPGATAHAGNSETHSRTLTELRSLIIQSESI